MRSAELEGRRSDLRMPAASRRADGPSISARMFCAPSDTNARGLYDLLVERPAGWCAISTVGSDSNERGLNCEPAPCEASRRARGRPASGTQPAHLIEVGRGLLCCGQRSAGRCQGALAVRTMRLALVDARLPEASRIPRCRNRCCHPGPLSLRRAPMNECTAGRVQRHRSGYVRTSATGGAAVSIQMGRGFARACTRLWSRFPRSSSKTT